MFNNLLRQLIDESCNNGNEILNLLDELEGRKFDLLIDEKGCVIKKVYNGPHLTYN